MEASRSRSHGELGASELELTGHGLLRHGRRPLRFSRWGDVCLMDDGCILGTDTACTWKGDDSMVGLEYDERIIEVGARQR